MLIRSLVHLCMHAIGRHQIEIPTDYIPLDLVATCKRQLTLRRHESMVVKIIDLLSKISINGNSITNILNMSSDNLEECEIYLPRGYYYILLSHNQTNCLVYDIRHKQWLCCKITSVPINKQSIIPDPVIQDQLMAIYQIVNSCSIDAIHHDCRIHSLTRGHWLYTNRRSRYIHKFFYTCCKNLS